MMQKSALDRYLDFYISNQDVENGKPDPEMYDKAIKKMDLEPGDCLIIEDNENGKKAAYGSGAWVMEVEQVNEVNFQSIMDFINNIENSNEMQIL
jgi:beta-phosphoglucomutase-like phosphatase (HAD superfamily)